MGCASLPARAPATPGAPTSRSSADLSHSRRRRAAPLKADHTDSVALIEQLLNPLPLLE